MAGYLKQPGNGLIIIKTVNHLTQVFPALVRGTRAKAEAQ